jgi:hypothetical protein
VTTSGGMLICNARNSIKWLGAAPHQSMITSHQLKSRTAAYSCAALIFCLGAAIMLTGEAEDSVLGLAITILGLAAFIALLAFCWFFLKARGRSPAWMYLLVFNVLGLLVMLCLSDLTKPPKT